MNCRLIFYAARKTSFCERALQKSFSNLALGLAKISFATDNEGLGALLTEAFDESNIVFVVGGLGIYDEKGIVSIISRAVSDTLIDDCKRLKNSQGDDGYIIRASGQLLVLLPDEPQQIESIMQGAVSKYIQTITKNVVKK